MAFLGIIIRSEVQTRPGFELGSSSPFSTMYATCDTPRSLQKRIQLSVAEWLKWWGCSSSGNYKDGSLCVYERERERERERLIYRHVRHEAKTKSEEIKKPIIDWSINFKSIYLRLCQEVTESRTLYVHIFVLWFLHFFRRLYEISYSNLIQIIYNQIYLTHTQWLWE